MLTLLPLLVVVLVVVVWAVRSHEPSAAPATGLPGAPGALGALGATLQRWVDAQLLTAEQARAILAHERPAAATAPRRRLPVAMEALGYLGGTLGLVGAVLLVAPAWDDLPFAAHLAIFGASALGFLAAGAALRAANVPALERLREFLWLLATVAAVGGLVVVGGDEGLDLSERATALLAAGGGAALSLALWRLRDRPLQHLTTYAGTTVVAAVAVSFASDGPGAVGLAIYAVALAWLLAARFAVVGPESVGEALGAVGIVVGTTTASGAWPAAGGLLLAATSALALVAVHRAALRPDTIWTALGGAGTLLGAAIVAGSWPAVAPVLGLVAAGALTAVGVATRERAAAGVQLAVGLLGLFAFVPWTMLYFFGDALGPAAVLLVTGAAVLALAVVVLRRQGGAPGATPPPSGSVRVV